MPSFESELDGGRAMGGSEVELYKSYTSSVMRFEHQAFQTQLVLRDSTSPEGSDRRRMSLEANGAGAESKAKVDDDFNQIDEYVASHENFLEALRKHITNVGVVERAVIFQDLQGEILREAGGQSWYGLTSRLVGYIKVGLKTCPLEEETVVILQQQIDYIGEQVRELRLLLETDYDIFKIAAGTLLYAVAVIKHIERKRRFGQGCCSPLKSLMVKKPTSSGVPPQLEEVLTVLKDLQDNLVATLARVGSQVSHSVSNKVAALGVMSIGVDQHVRHIVNHFQKSGVRVVGIHGHAGVGKTTLLNEVVTTLQSAQKHMFAAVEVTERAGDLCRLQASLLQQLGGGRKEFTSTAQGRNALLYQLQKLKHNKKLACIAIDNLFDIRLIGELFPHSLGKVLPLNSFVIVTSPSLAIINRFDQLCRPAAPQYHFLPYKLPALGALQARTLFLSYAVMHHGMVRDHAEVMDEIVQHCDGNPLALKVAGSYFAQEANASAENWTSVSKGMKAAGEIESVEDRMFGKLQVIYNKLDTGLKEAFLDIAIFFRGWDWRVVERIVNKSQMRSLMRRAMIAMREREMEALHGMAQWTRYSEYPWKVTVVGMHDLLAAIGSRRAQGNRIMSEDQTHLPEQLLIDSPGNELSNIQALSLISCKEAVQGHILERLQSLRLLILHDIGIRGYCTKALHELQFFYWGRSQPSSDVKIPFQMNRMKRLEVLILRAHEIDLNLKYPPQLKDLTFIGCNNMEELPDLVSQLSALVELHFYFCSRLQDLTEALGNLRTLTKLRLENCGGIKELPRSLGNLTNLREIDLSGCQNLSSLVPEIGSLVNLHTLDVSRCKSLTQLPPEIGGLRSLVRLFLAHCPLTSICPEIGRLVMVKELSLTSCAALERLPKEIGKLVVLETLVLRSCIGLKELPEEIGQLGSLLRLDLSNCTALLRLPNELWSLTTLEILELDCCGHLKQLPKEIGNLVSLRSLSLNKCTMLSKLPAEVTGLPSLQVINVIGCTGLSVAIPPELKGWAKDTNAVKIDYWPVMDDDLSPVSNGGIES